MKKYSFSLLCSTLTVSVVAFLALSQAEGSEPFLEPMIHGSYGLLRTTTTNAFGTSTSLSTTAMSGGGGLRVGLENEGLFAAADLNAAYWSIGDSYSLVSTFGISAGGTFVYVPLRLWIAFDPIFATTLSGLDNSPFAARLGLSYFVTSHFTFGFILSHLEGSAAPSTGGTSSGSATSVGLLMTLPFNIESPKEPWRARYEKQERRETLGLETEPTQSSEATTPLLPEATQTTEPIPTPEIKPSEESGNTEGSPIPSPSPSPSLTPSPEESPAASPPATSSPSSSEGSSTQSPGIQSSPASPSQSSDYPTVPDEPLPPPSNLLTPLPAIEDEKPLKMLPNQD